MCKKVSASPASCRRRPSRRCPVQYEHVAPDCAGRRCRVCWPIAPHAGGCKQSALQLQGRKKFFCPVGEAGWENRRKKARPTQPHCAGRACLNPGQVQAGACAQAVRLARQDAGVSISVQYGRMPGIRNGPSSRRIFGTRHAAQAEGCLYGQWGEFQA